MIEKELVPVGHVLKVSRVGVPSPEDGSLVDEVAEREDDAGRSAKSRKRARDIPRAPEAWCDEHDERVEESIEWCP